MLYFTEQHEWLRLDGDVATVGITSHAQDQLGDLVYVELPQIGQKVAASAEVAVVESTKAASDVFAPVAGEIVAVNEAVVADPALINRAAEGDGWLFRMRLADPAELATLLDRSAYTALIGG